MGVKVVEKGSSKFFSCINPDHEDSNPSSSIFSNGEMFHCFSCNIAGDIFRAASYLEDKPSTGAGFVTENVEYILNKYGIEHAPIELTEEQLSNYKYESIYEEVYKLFKEQNPDTLEYTHNDLTNAEQRGWKERTCIDLGIGTIKDYNKFIEALHIRTRIPIQELKSCGIYESLFGPELLTFCIRDHKGSIRGFVARYVNWTKDSDTPKYRNTSIDDNPFYKKERILYMLNNAKRYNDMRLDIYEGYGSAVTAYQMGIRNACSIGGTALTEHHINLIRQLGFRHVNLVLDADATGTAKMDKYLDKFGGHSNLEVTITKLPFSEEDLKEYGKNDPDYFLQKYGIEAYRNTKAISFFQHMLEKTDSFEEDNPLRIDFCNKMIPLLLNEGDLLRRSEMIKALAEHTSFDKEDIRAQIASIEKQDTGSVKEGILKDIRRAENAEDIQNILSNYQHKLQDTSSTKKDRYTVSLQETVDAFDKIFLNMNQAKEGIHGWKTGFEDFDDLLDGIPIPEVAGRLIGFAGAPQAGKQLDDNTPILTPDGFKNHGDLKIGDIVFGPNGNPIKVTAIMPKNTQNCKVTFSDGEEILCHENHEWVVIDTSAANRNNSGRKIVTTKYLESIKLRKGPKGRGGRFRFQVDSNTTINFEKKKLDIPPYVLGLWLGDGRSTASDIAHTPTDREHIKKAQLLMPNNKTTAWVDKPTGVVHTSFKGLITKIRSENLYNNKHIPTKYLTSSLEDRLELLAGLIDSDGYLHHRTRRFSFSNTNKRLIEDTALLVRSLGCRATITTYPPKEGGTDKEDRRIKGTKPVYVLSFNLHHKLPTALPRKKWEGDKNTQRKRAIVLVERVNPSIGNCIEVEGGIYLAGKNLIPTHNSASMLNILMKIILNKDNKDLTALFWAIDDNRKSIAYRLIPMISGVSIKKVLRQLPRTEEEDKAIIEAQEIIRQLIFERRLIIKDDSFSRSKAKAETWIKETQDQTSNHILFCVDSLHNVDGKDGQEARAKIMGTSSWLKGMTASCPATIMTTIELVKNRSPEKPNLQTISESAKVEYDFDSVAICWNEQQGKYQSSLDNISAKWGVPGAYKPVIELDFQKNKCGAGGKGSLYFKFDPDTTSFVDCCNYPFFQKQVFDSTINANNGTSYKFYRPKPEESENTEEIMEEENIQEW